MPSFKKLSAATLAASAILGTVAAPAASAKSDPVRSLISPGTCKTITKLANDGKPVPDPSILHDEDSVKPYFQDGVLEYKVVGNFPYRKQLDAAVAEWNKALKGKASLKEVKPSEADDDTVAIIYKPDPNGYVQGAAYPDHKMVFIKIPNAQYPEAVQGTIAHELGHMMGAGHSCAGALMAGANQNPISYHVTPLDAAAVIQGQFD
ncbi:M48 family metalloprotease [uncultured Corynebacterium sp.]|uniref:M48 family metalloprotease n=1 Tax=uncultured Corynebacterium sp. TaxID=159447 RepID=UPI0025D78DC0|nr:M48 family metalloprotease [uncultured Corynebacterium sp.]